MKLEGFANLEINNEIDIPKEAEVLAQMPLYMESLAMPVENTIGSTEEMETTGANRKSISFGSNFWGYSWGGSGNMWGKGFEMPSPILTDHGLVKTGTQGTLNIWSNWILPGTTINRYDAAEMVGKAKAQTQGLVGRLQEWMGMSACQDELEWVRNVEVPQQMQDIRKRFMPGGPNYVPSSTPVVEIKPEQTKRIKSIAEESAREDSHLTIGERIDKIVDNIQPFIEGLGTVLENPQYRNPFLKIINDIIK